MRILGEHILYTLVIELDKKSDKALVKDNNEIFFHFNSNLCKESYNILFHDKNLIVGQFESLLCKKKCSIRTDHELIINITAHGQIQHRWMHI